MTNGIVHIVDDNAAFRASTARVLEKSGNYSVVGFESGKAYLENIPDPLPNCLIVDLQMPGIDGLALQIELQKRKLIVPTIVLSAYASLASAVKSVKHGAFDVFQKPCDPTQLLEAVRSCINGSSAARFSRDVPDDPYYVIKNWDFIARYYSLSRRQREIAERICRSMSNDAIAYELFITNNTVRMHVKALYEKLHVNDRVGVAMRCLGADILAAQNGGPSQFQPQ